MPFILKRDISQERYRKAVLTKIKELREKAQREGSNIEHLIFEIEKLEEMLVQ